MGWFARLLGIEEPEKKALTEDLGFLTDSEEQSYKDSILSQLSLMEQSRDMQLISKYLSSESRILKEQANAIKKAFEVIDDKDNEQIKSAFETYSRAFNEWALQARGKQTISNFETINEAMREDFTEPIEKSGLNIDKLVQYINQVRALQEAVDTSEDNKKPILIGNSRDTFNRLTVEAQYRLKMLELLTYISINPDELGGEDMPNPFKKTTPSIQKAYAEYFTKDMDMIGEEYDDLSYESHDIDSYGENHKFSDMDGVVESFNSDYSVQALRDPSLIKMFEESTSNNQLFEFLKKIVFVRYKINEINGELSNTRMTKMREEERMRVEAELERQSQIEAELARVEEEKKAAKRAERLKVASDEELQGMLNAINYDINLGGDKNEQLLEFQMNVAKLRGLIPAENPLNNDDIEACYLNARQIIEFVKKINKTGLRYMIFPDSQEYGDGRFCVLVPKGSKAICEVPPFQYDFYESNELEWNPELFEYRKIGTVPGYILADIQKQMDRDYSVEKDITSKLVYVDEIEGKKALKMGIYDNNRGGGEIAYSYMKRLIKKSKSNLKDALKGKDQNVMCYLSIPVSSNFIPVLRAFKENDVELYLERTIPEEEKPNKEGRTRVNIYFHRKDMDKFYDKVQPQLGSVNYKVHYGKKYDFVEENSRDLDLIEETYYGQ